jgi:DNA-binding MarR family transcriptional regulator
MKYSVSSDPKKSKARATAPAVAIPPIDPAQTEQLYEAICVLLKILTVGEDVFAPAGGKIKYNGTDFQAIAFIGRTPGCMATQLSQFLAVRATTTTSTIDRLVKQGLVLRTRPENNRRAVALELTQEGQATFEAMVNHDMQSMRLMLSVVEPEQRPAFVDTISKISAHFLQLQAQMHGKAAQKA